MPVDSFCKRLGWLLARNLINVQDEDLNDGEKNEATQHLCRFYLKHFDLMCSDDFRTYCQTNTTYHRDTDTEGWYEERIQFLKRVKRYSGRILIYTRIALRSRLTHHITL
jgi:hypothetical protein